MDATHPYSRDLDVFGAGSLFEFLCTVRTRAGEETLARWLLESAPPDEVRARQRAAQELRRRVKFRERLFTAGDNVRLGLHPDSLTAWGEGKSFLDRDGPILAATLAFLWVLSIPYGILRDSYLPVVLLSVINVVVNYRFMRRMAASAAAAERATEDLDLLVQVLRILEQEPFQSPKPVHLQSALKADGITPSAAVKKLGRILSFLEQRRNPFLLWFGLDFFLFYTVQWTFRAEAWRRQFGPAIRGWLAAVGGWRYLPRSPATHMSIPATRGLRLGMKHRVSRQNHSRILSCRRAELYGTI